VNARESDRWRPRELSALVLAVGLATAVNAITVAVLWDAIRSAGPGLSENATQVLVTAFGGIIGILGSYLGFKAGRDSGDSTTRRDEPRDKS